MSRKLIWAGLLAFIVCLFGRDDNRALAQPCQWNYSMVANIATATYCGNVVASGSITGSNPVTSMTALKALTSVQLAAFKTVTLTGYYAGATYGGGTFVWMTSAQVGSLTPDGGTIIAPADSPSNCSAGCSLRIISPGTPWLVDWFGMSPNNTGAANTAAWTAFNSIIAVHDWTFSSQKVYNIAGSLKIPSGAAQYSIDGATSGIVQATANTPIFEIQGGTNLTNITFKNIFCSYGTTVAPTDTHSICIDFGSVAGSGGQWEQVHIFNIVEFAPSPFALVGEDPSSDVGPVNSVIDQVDIDWIVGGSVGHAIDLCHGSGGSTGLHIDHVYGFSTTITAGSFICLNGYGNSTIEHVDRTGSTPTSSNNQIVLDLQSSSNNKVENLRTENETYTTAFNLINISNSWNEQIEGVNIAADTFNLTGAVCAVGDSSSSIDGTQFSVQRIGSAMNQGTNTYTSGNFAVACPATVSGKTHRAIVNLPIVGETGMITAPTAMLPNIIWTNNVTTANFVCSNVQSTNFANCGILLYPDVGYSLLSTQVCNTAATSTGTISIIPSKNNSGTPYGGSTISIGTGTTTRCQFLYFDPLVSTAPTYAPGSGDFFGLRAQAAPGGTQVDTYNTVIFAKVH